MQYNIYIQNQNAAYNIRNLSKDDLNKVVDAYNQGKNDFFLNGTKYSIEGLNEIKIFTFDDPENFNEFVNREDIKKQLQWTKDNKILLSKSLLGKCGTNVTGQFIFEDFGYLKRKDARVDGESLMDIFISHSSEDADVAKTIIELIKAAFNLPSEKIRCTSVNGYKLKAGASTEAQLKIEILHSKVLLAIITPQSVSSLYVLFELGARWGLSLPLIPLVTSKQGFELLKGPLGNINALLSCDGAQLHQLLDDLGEYLELKKEPAAVYQHIIDSIVQNSLTEVLPHGKPFTTTSTERTTKNELNIIKIQAEKEYPMDFSMQVYRIKEQRKALELLKAPRPTDIPLNIFNQIREKAETEWPVDFEMRLYSENEQIEAYRELNGSH